MVEAQETGRAQGRGVVTGWRPEDLARKDEIERKLIADGYRGAELEAEALRLLEDEGIAPMHRAESTNTFVNGGTNLMMLALTGGSYTAFNNANAALGVGDSSAAFALTQTNLQGTTNVTDRVRKAMDATFPTVAANVSTFRATFATTDANFVWNEWGLFNNVTDGSGTMLNRSVANLGTKTSALAWQFSVTITQT